MLIQIAEVFTPDEAAAIRQRLDAADWVDGKVTAGFQSASVKHNRQLSEQHPLAQELGNLILQRLSGNNLFMSAALPRKIFPPLFNRYEGGGRGLRLSRRQRRARHRRHRRARAHGPVGHAVLLRA